MATATQKERTARQVARRAKAASAGVTFLVVEDNSGHYRWMVVDGRGESLAESGIFATHDAAQNAANVVREAANPNGAKRKDRS